MSKRILISDLFRNGYRALTNRLRLIRRLRMDYVVLRITGAYPERTLQPERRFPLSLLPWPPPPPSVESFTNTLERIVGDPRVKGIVLIISGLSAGPATLGSLRQAILRFRESGKRAVAYLHDLSMWSYYLASACDEIAAPESVHFRAAGLWSEALFLKDTLALVGIEADFEAIAEYKVSPDTFRRAEMTEPHRKMLESLLDSLYDEIVGAISEGRGLTPRRVQELLDSAPLTAEQACAAELLDMICYEDELPAYLGTPQEAAVLVPWDQAQRRLLRPRRWRSRQAIGVISLEGLIVPGSSRRPPLPLPVPLPAPTEQAGSDTLVQQLRAATQDRQLGAVILHVDSPGGSDLASDLIWREVAHLRRSKPIVVYMSNQATSGGYYVSTPANAIIAQPTTLTGSIGIWGGKVVTRKLFAKIQAHREIISRGKAAGLYADAAPFSDQERAKVRADIGAGYERFKARVAEGRGMSDEEVEAVARGRVWTGEQALDRGLVDGLGDLQAASDKARELADLPPGRYAPLVDVRVPKQHQLPQPIPVDAGEWLSNLTELLRERVFAMAPWVIRIRG
ncbi:MAG: S49 family peptidase [Anaerolineae bacterium]|jgi:protease-4